MTADHPTLEENNRRLVERHFDEFVNGRDLDAIDRNMAPDFVDHDGPSGAAAGREGDRAMMAAMHRRFPDLRIELKDVLAEGDKVAVRAVWSGTDADTGAVMGMRGFVLWRILDGRMIERWATVTPMRELAPDSSQGHGWAP